MQICKAKGTWCFRLVLGEGGGGWGAKCSQRAAHAIPRGHASVMQDGLHAVGVDVKVPLCAMLLLWHLRLCQAHALIPTSSRNGSFSTCIPSTPSSHMWQQQRQLPVRNSMQQLLQKLPGMFTLPWRQSSKMAKGMTALQKACRLLDQLRGWQLKIQKRNGAERHCQHSWLIWQKAPQTRVLQAVCLHKTITRCICSVLQRHSFSSLLLGSRQL